MSAARPPHHAAHRRRGRLVALLTAVVLSVNAAVLTGGWAEGTDPDISAAAVGRAATYEPVVEADIDPLAGITVAVPVATATDPAAPLPVPEPPPTYAYAPTPEIRHGQLEIPAIGLSQPFFEGVTLTSINRGPSHWPGTAMPGELGNVVIAGHRTTYTKPFWSLNELNPGDELIFTVGDQRIVYALERVEIVSPTDVHIIDQTHERRATLFACHPRGSARQRIVGHFRMLPTSFEIDLSEGVGSVRSFSGL